MSNNLENDRSVTTGKMYPIDLAPQKITIVKSMSNTEVKMAHLIPGQAKTTNSSQIISHGGTGSLGLMRTAAQIISPGVASQPQMIVSGSPILQGTQIVSQGSQLIGQNSQIISQPQLISSGQLLSPGTQIISQGTQLSAQVSSGNNTGSNNITNTSGNGSQLLNVGGLVSGSGNLVVSSSVRTLPPSVRVLPPMPQHTTRPAVLSTMNVSNTGGVLVSKGVTSHVPRGLAAGASLAVRPVTNPQTAQNSAWSSSTRGGRGGRALVYGCRARSPAPRAPPPPQANTPSSQSAPLPAQSPHSALVTLPATTVLATNSVISSTVRGQTPRTPTPTPPGTTVSRPLPLLQRNYQPTKVVGVASVGVRGVGNSAPPQLYYEVPRPAPQQHQQQQSTQQQQLQQHQQPHQQQLSHQLPRPLTPYGHSHNQAAQVSLVNTVSTLTEVRQPPTSVQTSSVLPRPSILRKREIDGSPTKISTLTNPVNAVNTIMGTNISGISISNNVSIGQVYRSESTGWEDVPSGAGGAGSGSTTISAPSSPAPDIDPDPPTPEQEVSPRKKPRKQILISEVRQCDYPPEDSLPSPPPSVPVAPLPKRPSLGSSYVCGWRSTALHFARPADVRRREPRARDIVAIAGQRHVLTSAEGWKVHHLTAQMDDLVSLEADVGEQLVGVLRALENAAARTHSPIQALQHTLLELIKGNIQRSKIVCEGIQEAREDILRVFKHRNFVSDILTRQADKRCFRKHRSQS